MKKRSSHVTNSHRDGLRSISKVQRRNTIFINIKLKRREAHKILFLSFVCMRQLRRQLCPREKLYARAKKFEFTHQMTFTPVLPPLASLTTTNLVTVVMSVLGACMRRSSRASPSTWWKDYPRPMSGILVAMTVIKSTLASSGRLAM